MTRDRQQTRPLLVPAEEEDDSRRRGAEDDDDDDEDDEDQLGTSFLSATLPFSDRPSSFASHFAPPPPITRRRSSIERGGGAAAAATAVAFPDAEAAAAAAADAADGGNANETNGDDSWTREALALAKLAVPLAVEGICNVSLPLVTLAFVGRIPSGGGQGDGGGGHSGSATPPPPTAALALSAAVMANSIFTVTGYSLICGLASALETLCGAAYGAGELPLCGVLWMRAVLLCLAAAALPAALFISGALAPLLIALGQPPDVVSGCARYLRLLAPAVVAAAIAESTQNYLLAQGVARPGMAATLLTLALSLLYNRVLVLGAAVAPFSSPLSVGGLGLDGAALAQVASFATLALLLSAYKARRDKQGRCVGGDDDGGGTNTNTWPEGGWRTTVGGGALAGWPAYLRVAYGAVLLLWLEWAAWEAIVGLAGLLPSDLRPELAVGVAGLAVQLSLPPYMVSFAVGTAVSTRVAQALGAGNERAAKRSARVALSGVALLNAALAAVLFSARHAVPRFFAPPSEGEGGGDDEHEVAAMTASVVPAICLTMLLDGQNATLSGALRGAGRQGLGALLGLVCYWLVGVPLSVLFGFRARLGVVGLWAGAACGAALQAVLLHAYFWGGRLDWRKEVKRARRRLVRSGGGGGGG
jgi:MATE family multidrug resistance protein